MSIWNLFKSFHGQQVMQISRYLQSSWVDRLRGHLALGAEIHHYVDVQWDAGVGDFT